MTSKATNRAHATNRSIKAVALLDTLDRFAELQGIEPITASELEGMDDTGWQALARLAAAAQPGIKPEWTDASEGTRHTVIETLRRRQATPDPFDGFPR